MSNFKTVEASQITISQLMLPSHSNFSGKIHGGYILNLMDQIAFACASKHSETYCVTASVNTVDFLNPIEVGELVTLMASINYTGNTSMVVGIRVESQNIQTGNVKHCNSSYFTMVAKDEHGGNQKVPGIIVDTEEKLRRFSRSLKRMQMGKERREKYKDGNFNKDLDTMDLSNSNVKVILDS